MIHDYIETMKVKVKHYSIQSYFFFRNDLKSIQHHNIRYFGARVSKLRDFIFACNLEKHPCSLWVK